jgi:ferredoxin-NADP reductase
MKPEETLYKTIYIKKIHEEIKGFKTFVFEDGHNINYKPGQYLTLVATMNNEEVRRSYSITSSPYLQEPLTIGVKRVENGLFSRLLIDNAKAGDELTTIGAGGFFILPQNTEAYKQVFFFAAGSGITPVFSLIKTSLRAYAHLSVVLIYSNASPSKTIFFGELMKLKKEFAQRFHVEFLFSDSSDLTKARLHRDLLLEVIKGFSFSASSQILYYICGPQSYMRMCTYTLQEIGIPKGNIRKENFVIETIKPAAVAPPDTAMHTAHIRMSGEVFSVHVQYPDSILAAAKKKGIVLPYSCEVGRCGNCAAHCTKGIVWHSYNEVLTDKELNDGLVLTCVGFPVGGDVSLEIG